MSSQIDSLLHRQLEMARDWGLMGIAVTQSVLEMQFSQSNAWFTRNSERLQEAMSGSSAQWPEQWSAPLQTGLHDAMVSTSECLRLAAAIQAQMMRVVERQTSDARELLAEAEALLTDAVVDPGSTISIKDAPKPSRRTARAPYQEHRLAA